MANQQLVPKTIFFDRLDEQNINVLSLPEEDRECPACMGYLSQPVRLHGNHIYCKGCIKPWLEQKSNVCPLCSTELFEKDWYLWSSSSKRRGGDEVSVSVNNDRENLQRLRDLRETWKYGGTAAIRNAAENEWNLIVQARLSWFVTGCHTPPASDYADQQGERRTTNYQGNGKVNLQTEHIVQGKHLFKQLLARNTWLFNDSNQSFIKRPKPSLACHPIALRIARKMGQILRRVDGRRMSAFDLAMRLELAKMNIPGMPPGVVEFTNQMALDVAIMHSGVDVHPKGQAVRIRREEENDEMDEGYESQEYEKMDKDEEMDWDDILDEQDDDPCDEDEMDEDYDSDEEEDNEMEDEEDIPDRVGNFVSE